MELREIWRRVFGTKYSRLLEAEVVRLRAENRALLNSILGIAGVAPIVVTDDPGVALGARPLRLQGAAKKNLETKAADSSVRPKNAANVAAPMRRRSWHQIYRMLEIDSARKKEVV